MGLETGTWINDLVSSNPIGASDPKSQGDDHLRLIKALLQNTFPTASKAFYFPDALAKTAAYTVLAADENKNITGDATAGAFSFTLPTLTAGRAGWRASITKIDASANAVTVLGTINGVTNWVLETQWETVNLFWTGSAWIGAPRDVPYTIVSKSATATLTRLEIFGIVVVDTTGGSATITPPTAPVKGDWFWLKKKVAANSLIVDPDAATTIDGAATYTMTQVNEAILVAWSGTEWVILAHKIDITVPTVIYPASHVSNLLIAPGTVPASRVAISFDGITLVNAAGTLAVSHPASALVLNLGTSGAGGLDTGAVVNNTAYYIWIISDGTTVAAIAHATNNNAPTMPSGYSYKKLVGWVRTGGSAALYQSMQIGRDFTWLVGQAGGLLPVKPMLLDQNLAGTYSAVSPTLQSLNFVSLMVAPREASKLRLGLATTSSSGSGSALVAPSTAWGGTQNGPTGTNEIIYPMWSTVANVQMTADIVPEGVSIAWASSGAGPRLVCHGFSVPWV